MRHISRPDRLKPNYYHAHETARMMELEGVRLASFRARAIAIGLDGLFILLLLVTCAYFVYGATALNFHYTVVGAEENGIKVSGQESKAWIKYFIEFGVPILYWGVLTWLTNGRTPGKWLSGVRVVSTAHNRITLWQSIERALGYSVSGLEFGFGFFQYFISLNRRTAHDRLAETIVIRDRERRLFRFKKKPTTHTEQPVETDTDQPLETLTA